MHIELRMYSNEYVRIENKRVKFSVTRGDSHRVKYIFIPGPVINVIALQ